MNTNENEKWRNLLARSAPTFAGEGTPPYGFIANTMARLKAEKGEQQEFELIGWRAILASMAALVIAGTVALSVNFMYPGADFEPGVRSLVQMDNIQIS